MFGLNDVLGGLGGLSAAGGLVGGLMGLGNNPQLGNFQFSPDSLKSYSYNDISLARDNPELYQQLMQNSHLINQASNILNQRSMSMSPVEQANLRATKSSLNNRMAAQGLIGDPVAQAAMADQEAKMRATASQNAYQNQLAGINTLGGLQQQQYGDIANGQNSVMNANMQNRNAALSRDQMMNQRQLQQYQGAQQQAQGQNQFYSGLFSGGLGMLGQQANRNAMQDMYGNSGGSGGLNPYSNNSSFTYNSPSYGTFQ